MSFTATNAHFVEFQFCCNVCLKKSKQLHSWQSLYVLDSTSLYHLLLTTSNGMRTSDTFYVRESRIKEVKDSLCPSPTPRKELPAWDTPSHRLPGPCISSDNHTMPSPHLGLSNSQGNNSTKINLFWHFCFSSNSDRPRKSPASTIN